MSAELQKQLAIMKKNYLAALPEKVAHLRDLWMLASSTDDSEKLIELHRKAHSLAGSGATFDQEAISKAAKALENFVKEHLGDGNIFTETNASQVNELLIKVEKSFNDNAERESVIDESDYSETIENNLVVGKLKILIADDDIDNRDRLELILTSAGHEVIVASDGNEAVNLSVENRPDIILMDVIMPNMTGYDAARKIKSTITDKFLPILFLTAVTDNESLAGCISAGGDDFINKPVHPLILNAKLAAFQRISMMYEKLDEYQRKNEEEMEASKKVLDAVIYSNDEDIEGLSVWAKSPGHFSGDTRLCRKLDNGHIYVLLCDFTGHGLPAAIGTVFVSDLFRSMTSKNIPAKSIIDEVNSKMNQILPTGRYCAAIMLEYCPSTGITSFWNCGLPSAYMVNEEHKIISEYASHSVPLGVISGQVNAEPYILDVKQGNSMIFFSDGITEAEQPNGEMYGEEKLLKLIENTPKETDVFDVIKSDVDNFMDGEEPTDDISLVVFRFTD